MTTCDTYMINEVLVYLRERFPETCRHWFEDIEFVGCENGVLTLFVQEAVQLKYLNRCCVNEFTEAARTSMGMDVSVEFTNDRGLGF